MRPVRLRHRHLVWEDISNRHILQEDHNKHRSIEHIRICSLQVHQWTLLERLQTLLASLFSPHFLPLLALPTS